jgi:uncharacterized damage-inducible protein DinB
MTKQQLIKAFCDNHQEMIDYITSLTDEQSTFGNNGKWTAGQQFHHVYLTIAVFPRVLSSKDFIKQKFGTINRTAWSFDTVIENYLKTSRQAPEQYLPEQVTPEQRATIAADIQSVLPTIQQLLDQYTEEELDTLVLPHPLLGTLTIREMFYLMSYHATHHLRQTKKNLKELVK